MGGLWLAQAGGGKPTGPSTDLLQHGDLGLVFYFVLALFGMMIGILPSVWLLLRARDKSHEASMNRILESHAAELGRMLKAHENERKLIHEGSQASLKDLKQEVRSLRERMERLAEALFTLAKRIESLD